MSAEMDAARAWLDRCSPEYRAVLEQALHADVEVDAEDFADAQRDPKVAAFLGESRQYLESTGEGFLDSWQETRLRTQVAVGAFIESQTRPKVLIINRSASFCGVCGGDALPHEETHSTPCGWKKAPGCGVRWTHVTSQQVGCGIEEAAQGMRPDLVWVDPHAFIDSEKRRREDESIKRMVIPVDTKDVTSGREWTFIGGHGEWVDPCPSWDDIRPYGVTPGSPRDERMRARYEAGRAEHREDWTKWTVEYITKMIEEEDDDSTIYRAMRQWVMRERGLL